MGNFRSGSRQTFVDSSGGSKLLASSATLKLTSKGYQVFIVAEFGRRCGLKFPVNSRPKTNLGQKQIVDRAIAVGKLIQFHAHLSANGQPQIGQRRAIA